MLRKNSFFYTYFIIFSKATRAFDKTYNVKKDSLRFNSNFIININPKSDNYNKY